MAQFNKDSVEPVYSFTPAAIRKVASKDATDLLVKMSGNVIQLYATIAYGYDSIEEYNLTPNAYPRIMAQPYFIQRRPLARTNNKELFVSVGDRRYDNFTFCMYSWLYGTDDSTSNNDILGMTTGRYVDILNSRFVEIVPIESSRYVSDYDKIYSKDLSQAKIDRLYKRFWRLSPYLDYPNAPGKNFAFSGDSTTRKFDGVLCFEDDRPKTWWVKLDQVDILDDTETVWRNNPYTIDSGYSSIPEDIDIDLEMDLTKDSNTENEEVNTASTTTTTLLLGGALLLLMGD